MLLSFSVRLKENLFVRFFNIHFTGSISQDEHVIITSCYYGSLHAGSSAVGLGRASYQALICRPRAIFNGRACSQAIITAISGFETNEAYGFLPIILTR